ncbi:FtsX-like permease family protein [Schnuerera sp. xch1]|uniref:ABC transporter permease n=1 Tax=Schnuerera sp. xch1 TaxID=2874283 RepID=UPI001CBE0F70|nr:FtsX-like permease family protein [Schnuerera sp. xch1]MBZ2174447.1 FtsX-like permease family protein [Schnuerera sp. xch1]
MKRLDLRLLRLIKNSKGQFIAITILVIVGLTIYTALSTAIVNLEDTLNYYYDEKNFAHIFVQSTKIPESALNKVKKINGVKEVEGRVVFDIKMESDNSDEKVKARIVSISDNSSINKLHIVDGNEIETKNKDAIVIEQFANARNIKINDTIKPYIEGRIFDLRVSGISASPEYVYLMEDEQSLLPMPDKFGIIFVSEEFARQNFGFKDSFNEILITVKDKEHMDRIKDQVENELDQYGIKRIYDRDDQLSNRMVTEEIIGVKQMSSTIPVIFLGVAAVIIAAMLSRMVRNDRMSIGVLKALGYSNMSILIHYTKFSILIGLIGSIFGVILGTILSSSMAKLYAQFFNIPMLKFKLYYGYMFTAISLSITFCTIAGIWGARRVLKILPAESMRPEPPKQGGRVFLDKATIIWKRLSFSWKMVLRNIFRNKKRFLFISSGIAMTFAITLMPSVLNDASKDMFDSHYSEFQKMEYNINFNVPLSINTVNEIKHIIDVERIEPKIEFPFEIVYGNSKMATNIIGLSSNTEFYGFKNMNGQSIDLPSEGIVLSEGLARFIGVQKGDKIKIKTFIPNKDDVYVEVKDIIKQSLGTNGYMNIETMSNELLNKNLITGVYIDSSDDVKGKLENVKNISSIQSLQDMRAVFEEFMGLMMASISMMILFAGILGFAIVYNSTVMNIAERRLEFSSLRVMGFSKHQIFKIITKENAVMTVFGIILGIPLGQFMMSSLEKTFSIELYTIDMSPTLSSYIITAVITIVFVVIAQLATYKKINKLDFIEALKNRIS